MAIAPNLIIFDMDGVLVDVTDSYRAAIQCTVANFTGQQVTNETIQEYKNKGGFNDDWLLSQQADSGSRVDGAVSGCGGLLPIGIPGRQ